MLPDGSIVRATNISPDKETGIGNRTEAQFIEVFRRYQGEEGSTLPAVGRNTLMSWTLFADMTLAIASAADLITPATGTNEAGTNGLAAL